MKYLFLRGEVPQDRNPQEIVFDRIEDVDDVWTQWVFAMTEPEDETELWYWHGTREKKFSPNFTERWVPSFETYRNNFVPDVIICRGGFKQFHPVLERFPSAFKVYHGAGHRFLPQPGFYNYDLVIYDFPEGVEIGKEKFPNMSHSQFIKAVPEKLFYPIPGMKIEYDVCFPANGPQARLKGHEFVYNTVPKDIKVLNLGFPSKFKVPSNVTSYRVLRTQMSEHIAKCKMGIITVQNIRGLPRTVPELIACNKPIVMLEETDIWRDLYIKSIFASDGKYATGEVASKKDFWDVVRIVLDNLDMYNPREYYDNYLSMEKSAKFIKDKIKELKK